MKEIISTATVSRYTVPGTGTVPYHWYRYQGRYLYLFKLLFEARVGSRSELGIKKRSGSDKKKVRIRHTAERIIPTSRAGLARRGGGGAGGPCPRGGPGAAPSSLGRSGTGSSGCCPHSSSVKQKKGGSTYGSCRYGTYLTVLVP